MHGQYSIQTNVVHDLTSPLSSLSSKAMRRSKLDPNSSIQNHILDTSFYYCQMNFLGTKEKPPLYIGIAVVSLMILTGLTLAGTAVALTVMIPVFVFLSPVLVPAVITSSFLATGFLASGSLGASGITLIIWIYKKEEQSRYTLHVRGVNKLARGGKLPGRVKLSEEEKPPEGDKQAAESKPLEREMPSEKDKPLEGDELVEEDKPQGKDKTPEEDKPVDEDMPLGGVKQASIPEISKVLLEEQNQISPKCCGPSTSAKTSHQIRFAKGPTKVQSIFMKEYQKVPRVGAFAFKHFTSRDKK